MGGWWVAKKVDVEVKVVGLRQLRNDIRKAAGPEQTKMLRQIHVEIARKIVQPAARREAPVRTGRLRNSIRGLATQTSASIKAGTNARVPYAGPIHWGWDARGIKPNMFIIRAVEKNRRKILRAFDRRTKKLAKKVGANHNLTINSG